MPLRSDNLLVQKIQKIGTPVIAASALQKSNSSGSMIPCDLDASITPRPRTYRRCREDLSQVWCAFGTAFATFSRIVYQTDGRDLIGQSKLFKKPLVATSLMSAGMCLCSPMAWSEEALALRQAALGVDDQSQQTGLRLYVL